jgi:RNA polymerase sigma-70 factor, ECF subfamily
VGGDLAVEAVEAVEVDAQGDAELLEAVHGLPLQRRAVVILRYGVGMTPAEIALVLDVPVGTVHSRLARALDQLRDEERVDRP